MMLAPAGMRGKPVSCCIMSENLTSCLADLCSCCKHGVLGENVCSVLQCWEAVVVCKSLQTSQVSGVENLMTAGIV